MQERIFYSIAISIMETVWAFSLKVSVSIDHGSILAGVDYL